MTRKMHSLHEQWRFLLLNWGYSVQICFNRLREPLLYNYRTQVKIVADTPTVRIILALLIKAVCSSMEKLISTFLLATRTKSLHILTPWVYINRRLWHSMMRKKQMKKSVKSNTPKSSFQFTEIFKKEMRVCEENRPKKNFICLW